MRRPYSKVLPKRGAVARYLPSSRTDLTTRAQAALTGFYWSRGEKRGLRQSPRDRIPPRSVPRPESSRALSACSIHDIHALRMGKKAPERLLWPNFMPASGEQVSL